MNTITLTKLAGDSDSELFSAQAAVPTPALPESGQTHALPRRASRLNRPAP